MRSTSAPTVAAAGLYAAKPSAYAAATTGSAMPDFWTALMAADMMGLLGGMLVCSAVRFTGAV